MHLGEFVWAMIVLRGFEILLIKLPCHTFTLAKKFIQHFTPHHLQSNLHATTTHIILRRNKTWLKTLSLNSPTV